MEALRSILTSVVTVAVIISAVLVGLAPVFEDAGASWAVAYIPGILAVLGSIIETVRRVMPVAPENRQLAAIPGHTDENLSRLKTENHDLRWQVAATYAEYDQVMGDSDPSEYDPDTSGTQNVPFDQDDGDESFELGVTP